VIGPADPAARAILTTMTIPNTSSENIRPHLKVGTILLPRLNSTYVGRSDHGLEVSSPARSALAAMDGARTCEELSCSLGVPLDEIENLVRELDEAGLIDTEISKISVHTRFHSPNAHRASHDSDDSNDGAVQQLRAKLAPELSLATWLANVRDGGIDTLSRRRNWQVDICGDSRIATILYGILLSSGISKTSIQGSDDQRQIRETDLCAGFFHPGDIGHSFATRTQELSRELSLFPSVKKNDDEAPRKLTVAVGNAPAHQVQDWISQGIPHLYIDVSDSASISIGPIVIPGQSPCARCISMALDDQNPTWREISMQKLMNPAKEVPVSVAHCVAGIAALELLRFIDEGNSPLIGGSVRLDYRTPTALARQSFTRHPACGCNW
jgi:hypothetical protein